MCSQLILDFEKMRDLIDQNLGLPDVINTAADGCRTIEDFKFIDKAVEGDGTQVELTGIRSELKHLFSRNTSCRSTVKNTLPLSFNPNFCHADVIDKKIREISDETGYVYRTVPIHLTVNDDRTTLYRPYEYEAEGEILEPRYRMRSVPRGRNRNKIRIGLGMP